MIVERAAFVDALKAHISTNFYEKRRADRMEILEGMEKNTANTFMSTSSAALKFHMGGAYRVCYSDGSPPFSAAACRLTGADLGITSPAVAMTAEQAKEDLPRYRRDCQEYFQDFPRLHDVLAKMLLCVHQL